MNTYAGELLDRAATILGGGDLQVPSTTPGSFLAAIACERAQQVIDEFEDQWVRCGFNLTLPVQDRIRVLDEAAVTAENRLAEVARFRNIIERELRQISGLSTCIATDGNSGRAVEDAKIRRQAREQSDQLFESERPGHEIFAAMESSGYNTIRAEMIASANQNLAKIAAALFRARDFIATVRRQINVGEGSLLFSGALAETLAQYQDEVSSHGQFESRIGARKTFPGMCSDVR
jgi:hypothetical protein